ncbi:MAG: ATP-binding cassette domain-containing protein [Paracoccaceae bacterium]
MTLELHSGEVHAPIGENPACGWSTAMKIMSGYLAPTGGGVEIGGRPVTFALSREAEAQGVTLIHQVQPRPAAHRPATSSSATPGARVSVHHKAMRAQTQVPARSAGKPGSIRTTRKRARPISVPEKVMVEIASQQPCRAMVSIMTSPPRR